MATQPGDNVPQGPTQPGEEAIFGETKGKRATMPGDLEEENTKNSSESIYTLAGFLVSFSKTEKGEYWPLRQGNNTLGSSAENSIILEEVHVSDKHAILNITKSNENSSWKFQLVDLSSTNGTYLNDNPDPLPVFQGTVIQDNATVKMGEYILKLFSADKFIHQLSKNEKFKDSKPESKIRWDDPAFFNSKRPTNT